MNADAAVVLPWRPGCPHREAAWHWVIRRYYPLRVAYGLCDDAQPFSRTQAILDGAAKTHADVLVIADADVWCDGIWEALAMVRTGQADWAVPHRRVHRLSQESTALVLEHGVDWRGLPLSTDNRQDRRPYIGNVTGTLLVISRAAFEAAPPDPRFVGWGQEDEAWAAALRTLVGPCWRGDADLMHLWHPPQERISRRVGNLHGEALRRRYQAAERRPSIMQALIDESRCHAAVR